MSTQHMQREKLSLGNRQFSDLKQMEKHFCAAHGPGRTVPALGAGPPGSPPPPTLSSQTPAERVLTEPPPVTPTSQEPED